MSPSVLPDGEAAPEDGALPASAAAELPRRALGAYVHVPFCATRCGYCDFNTYTAAELGAEPGDARTSYLRALATEIDVAARTLTGAPPLSTVFFGGGTPTTLAVDDFASVLGRLRARLGMADDAEVTTEANPDSVTEQSLVGLREAGVNRISFGMQSSAPHVLATLERTHTPGRALQAVRWARAAGFDSVSLDLIYGTPGESLDDWRRSLDDALSVNPDHVSAYSLIVEDGTRLAAQVRRGVLPMPDEDDLADKYVLADQKLSAAGLDWYEVSNWARPGRECRHNMAYWTSENWWGFGPGAHSHVGGVRWWNVKRPRAYAARLLTDASAPGSPAAAREVLTDAERREERVLLELRLADGLPVDVLRPTERARIPDVVTSGLAVESAGRLRLTQRGRLLADAVIRDLLD